LGDYFPVNTEHTINNTAQKVHISSQTNLNLLYSQQDRRSNFIHV
jgi:hypothetical protein